MQIRYVNGKKYRFEPNQRELLEVEGLKAQAAFREMDPVELAMMLEDVPAEKIEQRTAKLKEMHAKAEDKRIAAVQEELAKWEQWFATLRTRGQNIETIDTYGGWHTTRRG